LKPVVLQLIDSFNQGGSERQALQLTRLLFESAKFNVRLACLSTDGSLRESVSDLDLGEIPTFPLTSFYDQNAMQQVRRFVRWCKAAKVDIVHTHDFYTNIFGISSSAIARLPVRIASMRETKGMRTRAQKSVQRMAFSLAHGIVVNSGAVRNILLENGISKDKIQVVYNGLNIDRVSTRNSRDESANSLKIPATFSRETLFVTIVANMRNDVKDYPMFLRAAQLVKKSIPTAAFLLAGEGELAGGLEQLARELDIMDRTIFLGRCDRLADLLNVSTVCVLSSKAEGFSNSIIEYMAAGKPVVATDVGGAREAITEGTTGYLVQSGDHETMAARIISLLEDLPRALNIGEAGREVVARRFSCETQLRETEALYDRLLVNSHGK
jgi:glycosyltransferase involved in cell wall biosynthesis